MDVACKKDRRRRCGSRDVIKGKLDGRDGETDTVIQYLVAVSYTHLDVYKRQHYT